MFTFKKEGNLSTYENVDKPRVDYAKFNSPKKTNTHYTYLRTVKQSKS
jgi:hypothetical protein